MEFRFGSQVVDFEGGEGGRPVTGVVLRDGRVLPCGFCVLPGGLAHSRWHPGQWCGQGIFEGFFSWMFWHLFSQGGRPRTVRHGGNGVENQTSRKTTFSPSFGT